MGQTLFKEYITTEEELRNLLGYSSELVKRKVIDHLDQHCRHFIAQSPFLLLSTSDRNGLCDVSPRGDAPGFVLGVNEKTLIIPERPGNKRMDSLRNILENPRAGLLFMIPGLEETLRINGMARIIPDEFYLKKMEANGKQPLLGIVIEVEECYVHCAKSIKRSKLWRNETWPEKLDLPNIAQMIADHANIPGMTAEKVNHSLQESYTKRLY